MAHLTLSQDIKKIPVEAYELLVQRRQVMLLASGIASFTIVAVAAAMMALLF